jgi:uncharacterized membrane protein (UPF0127 family)
LRVNIPFKVFRAGALALLLAGASAASGGSAHALEGQAMALPVDPAPLIATTASGEKRFSIEVADDPIERERGLMFRQDMPTDRGMLFVFESTRPVGFWMKNTPMPLDLVFIEADGTIAAVQPGQPFSEAVISTPTPVRFVLELKQGTAAREGLNTGDKLRHPLINAKGTNG